MVNVSKTVSLNKKLEKIIFFTSFNFLSVGCDAVHGNFSEYVFPNGPFSENLFSEVRIRNSKSRFLENCPFGKLYFEKLFRKIAHSEKRILKNFM